MERKPYNMINPPTPNGGLQHLPLGVKVGQNSLVVGGSKYYGCIAI